ncbi:VRR-NUC domain-containing protein [Hyphomonas sp. GM-8P]|uniref:VRR-NUC domain-containing protein n=1 Tax=Hyphomonas sp. GM-8P TaxID=1280945 RepID=UPI000DBFAAED|nr:VRR-NUC domain-containing protein [Hyphomonas sp. GM-8P]RAN36351.1 hypothetical protein HY26_18915 [Hyphomonas sp. GM-8P]
MTKQPESALQKAVVEYLRLALTPHEAVFWHTPNGGYRAPRTAARLKAEGVVPGVADIIIIWAGRCIAIELKAKGGSQSAAQKAWADQFTTAGGAYAVCRSVEAVERFLDAAGINLRASVGGAS